jgi:hypothetical protein
MISERKTDFAINIFIQFVEDKSEIMETDPRYIIIINNFNVENVII